MELQHVIDSRLSDLGFGDSRISTGYVGWESTKKYQENKVDGKNFLVKDCN